MKKNQKNINTGSIADFSVGLRVNEEKTDHAKIFTRTLIAFLGSAGTVMSFVSAVIPEINLTFQICFLCFFTAFFCACISFSEKKSILMSALALSFLGLYAYKKKDEFILGFENLFNTFFDKIGIKYKGIENFALDDFSDDEILSATVTFLLICSIAISLIIGTFIICKTGLIVVFAAIFPILELVLYFGLIPSYVWIMFAISAIVYSVAAEVAEFPVSGKNRRLPIYMKISSQTSFSAALAFIICFVFSTALLNFTNYERNDEINELRTNISTYMSTFSLKKFKNDIIASLPSSTTPSGAINHGKLGKTDTINYTGNTMLSVIMPKTDDSIYLKGFIGANYTGSSWEELSDSQKEELENVISDFSNPVQFTDYYSAEYYMNLTGDNLNEINITVNNEGAYKEYSYIPYNINPDSTSNLSFSSDSALPTDSLTCRSLNLNYRTKMKLIEAPQYFENRQDSDELNYRNYVYENYLDIPETFTTAKYIYNGKEKGSLYEELIAIRSFLISNCEYSLEAGKTPFGKDFAAYFLEENRKGSCSHFATAAVLMCRYRGIPARYVEGYIIKYDDFPNDKTIGELCYVDVKDERAHAWAEIYLDGYGWIPFEVTPGYISSGNASLTENNTLTNTEITPVTPQTQTETVTVTVTETTTVTAAAANENTDKSSDTKTIGNEETTTEENSAISEASQKIDSVPEKKINLLPVLIPISVILVIIALFGIRYINITSSRSKRLDSKNPRKKAYAAGKYFLKICSYKKINKKYDESYEEFAKRVGEGLDMGENAQIVLFASLKSRFSDISPTKEEAQTAASIVTKLSDDIYKSLDGKDKIIYKYFYCLK